MKKLSAAVLMIVLATLALQAQQLYQGPASGSVASGVTVSTGTFTETSHPVIFRAKPIRNLFTSSHLPDYPGMIKASAPEGANYQIDPSAGSNPVSTEDFVLTKNFNGIPDQNVSIPPDPIMAVGDSHIVALVNSRFCIWNKSTGAVLKVIEASSWFSSTLSGADPFDPKIIYDQYAKRWVMVWLNVDATSTVAYFLISVSDDANPMGTWYNWRTPSTTNGNTAAGNWADYQGVGYDQNAIYITSNQFTSAGAYSYAKIRIIPKSDLYANTAGQVNWKDLWDIRHPEASVPGVFTIRPARMYGNSTTYYFAGRSPYVSGTYISLWKLTNPLTNPVLTGATVPVTAYSDPSDARQLGSTNTIDGGSSYLRNEPVYMNGKLYGVHAVKSGTGGAFSAVRYFAIDVNTNTAVEDVAMGVDNYFHTYPALALDGSGNLALTYTRSGVSEYAGAYYTTRPAGSTILTGSKVLKAGAGSYYKTFGGSRNRWGDYNGAYADPLDLTRVYLFTEYVASTNVWGTWVGELTFSTTAASIVVTAPNGGEIWPPASQQTITWTASNVQSVIIHYSTDNGNSWVALGSSVPASQGSYSWTVPNTPSTQCKVKVSDFNNAAVNDITDGVFTIGQPPAQDWSVVPTGLTGDIWGIDFADANNVWISSSTGACKRSTNGGLTWVDAGNAGEGAYSIAALSGTTAVVATGPSAGDGKIMRTTNGGTTWTQVYTASGAWFNFIDNLDNTNLWSLSDPIGGVFHVVKSSDGGATWTLANNRPSAPATTVYGANNSWYQVGNTLWFGTGGASGATLANRVYKSANGPDGPWTFATTTAQYSGSMAFSSATGNGLVGFWQTSNTLNKTTNGGTSFTALSASVGTVHGLEYLQGTGTAYAASLDGLFKTTDNGTTWAIEPLPAGTDSLNFVRMFGTSGLIGGSAGLLLRKGSIGPIPSISVTAPNGGENWGAGSVKNITWTSSNITAVKIEYTTNGGTAWNLVTASVPASPATFAWTVPNTPTNQAKVRISDASNSTIYDVSDNVFTIGASFNWQAVVNVKDAGTDNQNLTMGQSPLATNGLDPVLGELPLPPMPPAGIFDARFELPVTPPEASLKDYRHESVSLAEFVIKFQASTAGYPITLAWNAAGLPAGSFTLKDMLTGTIVNVNMKTQSSYTLTNTGIQALKIEFNRQTCKDVVLAFGWNILSVPVEASSMATGVLFPAATSPAYGYNGNYLMSPALSLGKGYFLRYPQAATISVCGGPTTLRTIPLIAGWNIIGGYDFDAQVSALTTTPAGIINSPFYGYSGGYAQATALQVGKGYWVRTTGAGTLNLPTAAAKAGEGIDEVAFDKSWGKIIITDAEGKQMTLFAASSLTNPLQYELPPVPPAGVFDARFASQRIAEAIGAQGAEILINNAMYPVEIRAEGIELRVSDKATAGKVLSQTLSAGKVIRIDNPGVNVIQVSELDKPVSFALYQNYPNPFNPVTSIKFSIPEKANVSLKIYNQLGQKVAELVQGEREAGSYSVDWNAASLTSGIYFYELQAGEFSAVKKLMLMK